MNLSVLFPFVLLALLTSASFHLPETVKCGRVSANQHEVEGEQGDAQNAETERDAKEECLDEISLRFGKCDGCDPGPPPADFCEQLNFWIFPTPAQFVTHENPDGTWTAWVSLPTGSTLTASCRPCP